MPVQKLNRAIKYRAYPTPEQQVLLSKTFGCVRFIWNQMLTDAQQFLDEAGILFIPTPAKYKKEFPFLKEIDSGALCNAQLDLKEARKRYREDPKSVGAPTLKNKRKSKMSYTTNVHSYKTNDGRIIHTLALGYDSIKLPKIGWVKINKHREPEANWVLKGATVSCTRSGKYFISLLYEFEEDIQPVKPTKETSLGLDYSSHGFYVDSNGDVANYPRFYRQSEAKLARAQRRLSRMQFGSHHYDKQLYRVRVLQEHVANQRKNFCHTVSTAIAKQYDAVFVEDINLRGLAGSLKLGKSTNDNGFGMFRTMLEYKLTSRGKTFAKINRWYPSSKTCSVCGFIKDDLTLADRSWTCSACGTTHSRDHNAAINIRNVGLLGLYPA